MSTAIADKSMGKRLLDAVQQALRPAFTTVRFLLLVILPVSLLVIFLDASGLLTLASGHLDPLMKVLGLPGEASLVFISSISLTLYSAIAVISSLQLTLREISIVAVMCLIAHSLLIECAVMKRTGSSFIKTALMRIFTAILAAYLLNIILPSTFGQNIVLNVAKGRSIPVLSFKTIPDILKIWLLDSGFLFLKLSLIILNLMIIQKILEEFKLLDFLAKTFHPVVRLFGLPKSTAFLWVVANVIGLTYGSAILIEERDNNKISIPDANLLNHHLAISHSLLEDTVLFATLGVPILFLILPRLFFAFIAVWLERLRRLLVLKAFRVGTL